MKEAVRGAHIHVVREHHASTAATVRRTVTRHEATHVAERVQELARSRRTTECNRLANANDTNNNNGRKVKYLRSS